MKSSLRLGDRARLSDRFLARTGSAPRRGTIVERYSGSYGLLEDWARAGESQRRGWNATAACLQPLVDGSRDPFAEQVLALMRVAPKGCATTGQSIDWTPALAVRGTALRRIAV